MTLVTKTANGFINKGKVKNLAQVYKKVDESDIRYYLISKSGELKRSACRNSKSLWVTIKR